MEGVLIPATDPSGSNLPEIGDNLAPDPSGSPGERPSWWRGPGGGAEVLAVAAPLVVSSLSWTVMTFVDRMMLSNWSGAAMSAAFVATVAWWAVVCLPVGLCSYTGTFVAQYHGSNQPQRIGPAVWQGVWVALAVSPLVLALVPLAGPLFALAGHTGEAAALEARYFQLMCYGAPAMLLAQSLSSFYSGRSKTVLVMLVDTTYALVNLVLDYWWIFGLSISWQGEAVRIFPAMGIDGAGWATVLSLWLKAATYLVLMLRADNRLRFRADDWRIDWALAGRLFRFGAPSGVQMLLDVLGFTVFIVLVGRLGAVESEATSMTFSIGSLAFMPICGLGLAASILVGQHLGENRDVAAARATWTTLHVAWAYMAVVSLLLLGVPQIFLWGFFASPTPVAGETAPREAVAATALVLMRFVACYNFMDAMLIVFVSALKGAGDTRFVLLVSLVMGFLLATLSLLAVEVFQAGIYGCWALVSCWIATLGILFFLRFLQGKWRSMRVIEMDQGHPDALSH
ncbi:MATE family efflux transporter [Botrimarina hoheduenensis]|uniref:Multidrug-efflux transporter n=1 Tax=Botrimarina hoheduenensis TaxID=2528000 RepID=A0A5C5W9S3_9BACT|nr:MATE family efflux transporter [Botrimarina hoheduenensis]TWT47247.1 Multidrug resistance protein NorM [Botrimarina hoheduenensis]